MYSQCDTTQSPDNWFPTPFYGQNQPPENTTTDVWVDAYLWRLNSVNEIDYQFNVCVLFVRVGVYFVCFVLQI